MLLHPQVLLPAHCYHAVHSAHKSLRHPPEMAQEVSSRLLMRSRRSRSSSFYSASESQWLLPSRFNYRFPTHFWMLLRRRPHPALCLSMSRRRWVLAQLPLFLLIRLCRLLHIVLYYLTRPHNSTSLSSSLAGFTQTNLLIVGILFVSPRHQYWAHMWHLYRRLDLNNQPLLL